MGLSGTWARLYTCLQQEYWSSAAGSLICVVVVAHSWRLHGRRAWRRSRVYTEIGAASTVLCTALLLVGYTYDEGSFLRVLFVDTLAMSLVFAVLQFIDNIMFLECAESVGFRIKNPWMRGIAHSLIFLLLFAWFPVYFSRGFTMWTEDDRVGRVVYAWAMWYYAPMMFLYNSVFGLLFIQRLIAMRQVRSSREGMLFVLVLKTGVRIILSTAGITIEISMEPLGLEITGSIVYMVVVLVSTHVLFNTKIDAALERWLFSSYAFFQEVKDLGEMLSPRSVSTKITDLPRTISRALTRGETREGQSPRRSPRVAAKGGPATGTPRRGGQGQHAAAAKVSESNTWSRSDSPQPIRSTAESSAAPINPPPTSRWMPPSFMQHTGMSRTPTSAPRPATAQVVVVRPKEKDRDKERARERDKERETEKEKQLQQRFTMTMTRLDELGITQGLSSAKVAPEPIR